MTLMEAAGVDNTYNFISTKATIQHTQKDWLHNGGDGTAGCKKGTDGSSTKHQSKAVLIGGSGRVIVHVPRGWRAVPCPGRMSMCTCARNLTSKAGDTQVLTDFEKTRKTHKQSGFSRLSSMLLLLLSVQLSARK